MYNLKKNNNALDYSIISNISNSRSFFNNGISKFMSKIELSHSEDYNSKITSSDISNLYEKKKKEIYDFLKENI